MPEEIEVPLEEVQEHIHALHEKHHGHEAHAHGEEDPEAEHAGPPDEKKKDWTRFVALTTALLAVAAALGALQSGLLVNEALLAKNDQIGKLTQASDQWSYYQAEGLKSLIYQTAAQQVPPASAAAQTNLSQAKHYKDKQSDIQTQAKQLEDDAEKDAKLSEKYMDRHHIFAFSVSLCQIAIALSAVAALMRRRTVWLVGLGAGIIGTILLIAGFFR